MEWKILLYDSNEVRLMFLVGKIIGRLDYVIRGVGLVLSLR